MSANDTITSHDGHDGSKRRTGPATLGVYPELNRTAVAGLLGVDKSTVSNILLGKSKPSLFHALTLAHEAGVTVEQLEKDLAEQRRARDEERGAAAAAANGGKKNGGKNGNGNGKRKR